MKPKYASLTADTIKRGITMRRVRIIGPDGEFMFADTPVEGDVEDRRCQACGSSIA